MSVISAPADWVELVEQEELETLVELSETISLARARALHLLGRAPR